MTDFESSYTQQNLVQLQNSLPETSLIVLKFTADWCGPCKSIKAECEQFQKTAPSSIRYYEIDIDESLELYMILKRNKMVNGIPALLAFKGGERERWYIPDDSQLSSDKKQLAAFFNRCLGYVQ